MADYLARYRKYFPAETREQVYFEISLEEGWVMIAAAMSLDGWLNFSGVKVEGYLKSEIDRLMNQK